MIELVSNERLDILFDERCLVCNVQCPRDEANKVNCRILFKDGARAFEAEVGVAQVDEVNLDATHHHDCRFINEWDECGFDADISCPGAGNGKSKEYRLRKGAVLVRAEEKP